MESEQLIEVADSMMHAAVRTEALTCTCMRVFVSEYYRRDTGNLVLPEFLSLKLCWSFAHAYVLSFLDCHEMRHFYHMLPPCCTASHQNQKELVNESWVAISRTVIQYKPVTLEDCLMYFEPVTQAYQQVEPVTTCEHQGVDLKSVSQVAVNWDIFSIWGVKWFGIRMTETTMAYNTGRGEWPYLLVCHVSPFSK